MARPVVKISRKRLSLRERLDLGNGFIPYFLVMPTVLVTVAVAIYPVLNSFWYSLLNNMPGPAAGFVGWNNYFELVESNEFRSSVSATLLFTTIAVTLETIFGLGTALLIHSLGRGRNLVQAAILVPWVFPAVIAAQMWALMYNDRTGIISYILQQMHILAPGATLLETNAGILTAIIIADVWKSTPFMTILLLAGLQTIPAELYEAAGADGATSFQQFWSITLPMLNKPLTVALLFRTVTSFGTFDLFYVLGANQVQSVASYSFNYMFTRTSFDFAPGVAAAVILFVIVVCQIAYRFSSMVVGAKVALRLTGTHKPRG
jgi:ABC-type sugar transport system permease subunit